MDRRRVLQTLGVAWASLLAGSRDAGGEINAQTGAQLLRKRYDSKATGAPREYFLYLPVGYESEKGRLWPVILFLHGNGERGDGLKDLDYTLAHGPLMEAWIQGRDLPFIMVVPQLPVFSRRIRADRPTPPERAPNGVAPPRPYGRKPSEPMERPVGEEPTRDSPWLPDGWDQLEDELLAMVDNTIEDYRADAGRVYLTGLSYGGYGTWYMATKHPQKWAAIAPICGGGDPAQVAGMVEAKLPVWIFQGGRDPVVPPKSTLKMAVALEAAGHPDVRYTVHEDLGHNVWTRVYEGQDLYNWFLTHRRG